MLSVRHLGTDINYIVLEHLYDHLKNKVDFYFDCAIETVEKTEKGYKVYSDDTTFEGTKCIISAGRSGSKWMQKVCKDLDIHTNSNRVDLGVRLNCRLRSFRILQMNSMRARSYTVLKNTRITCAPSV